eukprot:GFYU01002343.1.p1 GENE.GFYU01002343.1~~GFYU01002343.1.p1  ORF type:complete len:353 (-),score=74.30 GFYU01002343.1:180-1238(-)
MRPTYEEQNEAEQYATEDVSRLAGVTGHVGDPLMKEVNEDDVVHLDNVHKTYLLGVEGVPALRGVSARIKKGEFIVILGTSGGGKTSMLNIIGTIDKPTKGNLRICGHRISSKTSDPEVAELRLNHLGFVFQTFNLLSAMTAFENVEMPMVLSGRLNKGQRKERVEALLDRVGMTPRMKHFPSQLSGGEQQRVTIARAVANDPELLLLDEPTGDLDTRNSDIVMNLLVELNETETKTLVMVTHDVGLKYFAHRVFHMRDGKISRIEEIPEHRRDEAKDSLRQSLEQSLGRSPSNSIADDPEAAQRPVIEIRKPLDYRIHRFSQATRGVSRQDDLEQRMANVTMTDRSDATRE